MKQLLKPISLTLNTDIKYKIELLIAKLSEVKFENFTLPSGYKPYRFDPVGMTYVFDKQSLIAQTLLQNPEKLIEIDSDDFTVTKSQTDQGFQAVYSHKELNQKIKLLNENHKKTTDFTSIYPLSKIDDNDILATLNYLMNSSYIKERNEFDIDKEVVLTELKYADFSEYEVIKRSINITFALTDWDTENEATANLIYNINTPNDIGIIAIYEQNIGSSSFPVGYKVKVFCSNGHFYIFHPDMRGLISAYTHKIINRLNNFSIQELLKH